jgi:hypothetical protein
LPGRSPVIFRRVWNEGMPSTLPRRSLPFS